MLLRGTYLHSQVPLSVPRLSPLTCGSVPSSRQPPAGARLSVLSQRLRSRQELRNRLTPQPGAVRADLPQATPPSTVPAALPALRNAATTHCRPAPDTIRAALRMHRVTENTAQAQCPPRSRPITAWGGFTSRREAPPCRQERHVAPQHFRAPGGRESGGAAWRRRRGCGRRWSSGCGIWASLLPPRSTRRWGRAARPRQCCPEP